MVYLFKIHKIIQIKRHCYCSIYVRYCIQKLCVLLQSAIEIIKKKTCLVIWIDRREEESTWESLVLKMYCSSPPHTKPPLVCKGWSRSLCQWDIYPIWHGSVASRVGDGGAVGLVYEESERIREKEIVSFFSLRERERERTEERKSQVVAETKKNIKIGQEIIWYHFPSKISIPSSLIQPFRAKALTKII